MNIRTIITSLFISFLKFSYANDLPESCEMQEQLRCEDPLPVQGFEVRAFIIDIERAQLQCSLLGAKFKGEYEFNDYIYHPQDRDFDLNKEFVRLRVYQKTQWDQKAVELTHKVKSCPGVSGSVKLKKQFNAIKEANAFLSDYRLDQRCPRRSFDCLTKG